MVAAMCIKLTLFLGITYKVARMITFSDLDIERGTIKINDYIIRLPLEMNRQFKAYKRVFEIKNYNVVDGYIFITIEERQWGEKTTSSGIPNFLKTQLDQTSITSIVKYGVKQLIIAGISDNVIVRLTGISKEILNDCLQPVDDEDDIYMYINERVIKSPIYKYL